MFERTLIMGGPNTGKTFQILKIYEALLDLGVDYHIIDLEDKLEAAVISLELPMPKNFNICLTWEEYKEAIDNLTIKPSSWILVDRHDLSWNMVQRWFTQQKYEEELADKMLKASKDMKAKTSRFIPRFDQGSWQVINEQHEEFMNKILYLSRCNVLLTSGIKGLDENSPLDIGRFGVLPRGQKELGHQPHSLFLLFQAKEGREVAWKISTDKDLKKRTYFERNDLTDFAIQYLSLYYTPEKK